MTIIMILLLLLYYYIQFLAYQQILDFDDLKIAKMTYKITLKIKKRLHIYKKCP